MTITMNLLRNLLVLLVVLFCAILVIQSIDTVLAINVYIILHLMLMGGVLVTFIWVDWKETRKQFRERCQKMDEEFAKECAEKEEKFSRESQAFWFSDKPRLTISSESKARAAVVVKKFIANLEENKGLIIAVWSVSSQKVQKISFFDEPSAVYGPPPKPGSRFTPSVSKSNYAYGAPRIKRF